MKTTFFVITLSILTSSVFAGSCEIIGSSKEAYRLNFAEGLHEKHSRVTLEECTNRAAELLGQSIRMKTYLRDEVRVVTETQLNYADGKMISSAKFYLKK